MRMRIATLAVAVALAGTGAAGAADPAVRIAPAPKVVVVPRPVVVVEPPPVVVDYPSVCGPRSKQPFTNHCYGEYRPYFYPGCYWRHGYYVCPKAENVPPG